jgi:chaperonin GroES
MKRLEPLDDRVVIEPIEGSEITETGLFLTEGSREKPMEGRVLAVGAGRRTDSGGLLPTRLSPGMVVVYGKYTGTEVNVDDRTLLVLRESDVLAIVREEDA